MPEVSEQFSFRSRQECLKRFRNEVFDLLVVGGGITGAAVARDATSRGLKVALVERKDFAFGTSSRSSKLIHGGLRYLKNMEIGLVFEALSERSLLLKTVPHMVRPMPFYLPVYRGDPNSRNALSLGLWLYDLLALFRAPGFHQRLNRRKVLSDIPFLRPEGLLGGFRYFDASMWDDVLAVETLRAAYVHGAAVANYVEAVQPIWEKDRVVGFRVRDLEKTDRTPMNMDSNEWDLRAHRTVVCAGPWTDQIGIKLSQDWKRWLSPSKGVHLVFDLKRIPIPGAMVMNHPDDGRVSFVMPRSDYGAGVVIVGTTDGPTSNDPERAEVRDEDVSYLMGLLTRYFPDLKLTTADILSAYVGVRPLMGNDKNPATSPGEMGQNSSVLQKVSREHHIDVGPGGTVIVAGGKYTTHRKMAEEIVDFTLKQWKKDFSEKGEPAYPQGLRNSQTRLPVNPHATTDAMARAQESAKQKKISIPDSLYHRYGADALKILEIHTKTPSVSADPPGFACLMAQLRYSIRHEMVMHLEDFFLRRVPLFLTRRDHGLPWVQSLAQVWSEEQGKSPEEVRVEIERLNQELNKRTAWQTSDSRL